MKKQILVMVIALFACCLASYAQTSIRGVVTDYSNKSPVTGATVQVKGSKTAIITGSDGSYEISVPSDATLLIFQHTGYSTREVAISGRNEINIELQTDWRSLNEVMVVAYGTAKKGTYTGAASVVKGDDIKGVPSTSFQNPLVGRVAGVQVTTASGEAGATPSIRIRGIGSMNASNEPLYVIDGVPVISGDQGSLSARGSYIGSNNIMNTLNPADIETITILKDAAASSLYGSRAANGVVVITTKRGKKGKPVVHLSSSIGITPGWATDNYEVAGV